MVELHKSSKIVSQLIYCSNKVIALDFGAVRLDIPQRTVYYSRDVHPRFSHDLSISSRARDKRYSDNAANRRLRIFCRLIQALDHVESNAQMTQAPAA